MAAQRTMPPGWRARCGPFPHTFRRPLPSINNAGWTKFAGLPHPRSDALALISFNNELLTEQLSPAIIKPTDGHTLVVVQRCIPWNYISLIIPSLLYAVQGAFYYLWYTLMNSNKLYSAHTRLLFMLSIHWL